MNTFDISYPDGVPTVTLPAGRYAVSDPCYSAKDELYDNGLFIGDDDDTFPLNVNDNGNYLIGAATRYGDGVYDSNGGNIYSVDSGMIGMVSVNSAYDNYRDDPNLHVDDFPNGAVIQNDNGVISVYWVNEDGKNELWDEVDTTQ